MGKPLQGLPHPLHLYMLGAEQGVSMREIIIVGGGTAGWLTAAYLSARLKNGLAITLIEAADIPTIGVGEATTPSLRTTLADIGVNEYDFMRATSATFKHGIDFRNWTYAPKDAPHDAYFHPFERPLRAGAESLAHYWLAGADPYKRSFADAVCIQNGLAFDGFAPKRFEDPSYSGPMPYAYHLDAGRFATLLKKIAIQRGVKHELAKVEGAECDESGAIRHLLLEGRAKRAGDFFIDCTGFRALLIGQTLGEGFIDKTDVLFCNAAVTCQVPHGEEDVIRPYTQSSAQRSGWIWDIALMERRGVGHVYSTKYQDRDEAEDILRRAIGPRAKDLSVRHLDFQVGYRAQPWIRNCAAVGLSGGFIEPLESTGIHLIEQAAWGLAAMLPRYFAGLHPQSRFNTIMAQHYEMVVDFVKYHYAMSKRRDSAFWRDNVDEKSWTPWLRAHVPTWRAALPDIYDLSHIHSIFDHASYQYVALGMDALPEAKSSFSAGHEPLARSIFERVVKAGQKARTALPQHKDILARITEGSDTIKVDSAAYAQVNASVMNIPSNYAAR